MGVDICSPSPGKAEAGRSYDEDQLGLPREILERGGGEEKWGRYETDTHREKDRLSLVLHALPQVEKSLWYTDWVLLLNAQCISQRQRSCQISDPLARCWTEPPMQG